jgi:hypothetical protein
MRWKWRRLPVTTVARWTTAIAPMQRSAFASRWPSRSRTTSDRRLRGLLLARRSRATRARVVLAFDHCGQHRAATAPATLQRTLPTLMFAASSTFSFRGVCCAISRTSCLRLRLRSREFLYRRRRNEAAADGPCEPVGDPIAPFTPTVWPLHIPKALRARTASVRTVLRARAPPVSSRHRKPPIATCVQALDASHSERASHRGSGSLSLGPC